MEKQEKTLVLLIEKQFTEWIDTSSRIPQWKKIKRKKEGTMYTYTLFSLSKATTRIAKLERRVSVLIQDS